LHLPLDNFFTCIALSSKFIPMHILKNSRNCIILIFVCFSSFAQQNPFTAGIQAGVGVTNLYGQQFPNWYFGTIPESPDLSISAGAYFQYNFPKLFSIRSGLYYDRKGSTGFDNIYLSFANGEATRVREHCYLSYLTIPVLGEVSFGKRQLFFIEAGPFVSILGRAAYAQSSLQSDVSLPSPFNYTSLYRSQDVGAIIGDGINVPLPHNFLLNFEVRNSVGFERIMTGYPRTFSSVLLAGCSYSFGRRKIKHSNNTNS
jgi:hypothetical protein